MRMVNRSSGNGEARRETSRKFLHSANGETKQGRKSRPRQTPPEQTSAETFYYLKQINSRTPVVIVMVDGEKIVGRIEWYDRAALKVNRDDAPNLVVQKQYIKYVYKAEEER